MKKFLSIKILLTLGIFISLGDNRIFSQNRFPNMLENTSSEELAENLARYFIVALDTLYQRNTENSMSRKIINNIKSKDMRTILLDQKSNEMAKFCLNKIAQILSNENDYAPYQPIETQLKETLNICFKELATDQLSKMRPTTEQEQIEVLTPIFMALIKATTMIEFYLENSDIPILEE